MQVKNWILRRIFKYLSPVISLFENQKVKRYSKQNPNYSPVFIIGSPRSGSTILYQLITNFLDVSYIDNLIHFARENFFFGFWLSNKIFKGKPHNNFKSKHGNTLKGGLHAPSEGGQVWQKWLPKHTDYLNVESASEKQKQLITKNIYSVINKFNKPLIIKNNYNSLRLGLLKKIAPEAKIIFIKRDPLYTAQSIILVRENVYNDRNKWWSVKPSNYKELKHLPYIEQVVKQIYFIEKQINLDLKTLDTNNVLIVNYNELAQQEEFIENVKSFIGNIKFRENIKFQEIRISQKINIEKEVFENLKTEVQKYDWENYTS